MSRTSYRLMKKLERELHCFCLMIAISFVFLSSLLTSYAAERLSEVLSTDPDPEEEPSSSSSSGDIVIIPTKDLEVIGIVTSVLALALAALLLVGVWLMSSTLVGTWLIFHPSIFASGMVYVGFEVALRLPRLKKTAGKVIAIGACVLLPIIHLCYWTVVYMYFRELQERARTRRLPEQQTGALSKRQPLAHNVSNHDQGRTVAPAANPGVPNMYSGTS